jgi:hypothetical protein
MMKSLSLIIALTGFIFFTCSSGLFACHYGSGYGSMYGNNGHFTERMRGQKEYKNAFGITTETVLFTTIAPTEMSATSIDCKWMLARIEEFFNKNYPQIAEESAQGQGPHLEALAFQVGCDAQKTVLLEKAMQQNYHGLFAQDDINHSINKFYTVVNSDDQLAACWPKS